MKPTYEELEQQVADLTEILEDKRKLTKEIALIIEGPSAPENPSLGYILKMIKEIQDKTGKMVLELLVLKMKLSEAGLI